MKTFAAEIKSLDFRLPAEMSTDGATCHVTKHERKICNKELGGGGIKGAGAWVCLLPNEPKGYDEDINVGGLILWRQERPHRNRWIGIDANNSSYTVCGVCVYMCMHV